LTTIEIETLFLLSTVTCWAIWFT